MRLQGLAARLAWACTLAAAPAACVPDLGVPAAVQISCAAAADCPAGFVCNDHLARCVPLGAEDVTPPGVLSVSITPQRAGLAARATGVRVVLAPSEPLSARHEPEVTLVRPQGPVALQQVSVREDRRTFLLMPANLSTDLDGQTLALVAVLTDEAGNRSGELNLGTVAFDFTPPQAALRNEGVVQTVSRVQPEARVELTLREPVADPAEALSVTLTDAYGLPEQAAFLYEGEVEGFHRFVYVVGEQDAPGLHGVQVELSDLAGNAGSSSAHPLFFFDYEGPTIVRSTLARPLWPPAADTPLTRVAHATAGTDVEVSFVMSEALAGVPEVLLASTGLGASGQPQVLGMHAELDSGRVRASLLLPAALEVQGPWALVVTATDLAGNEGSDRVEDLVVVDTRAPAAPDSVTPGRILYERIPWGAEVSGGDKRWRVVGAAGAVDAGSTVIIYDAADLGSAAELGRGPSHAETGAFELTLRHQDLPTVYVAAVDGAGNRSPLAEVRDLRLVATMGFKQPNSAFENPFDYRLTARLAGSLPQAAGQATTPDEAALPRLALPDGVAVTASSSFTMLDRSAGASVPGPRYAHGLAYDSLRDRVVLYGGVIGSNVSTNDTWEWDGDRWEPTARSGPFMRRGTAMVFDAQRGVVVLFGGTYQQAGVDTYLGDTWLWSGSEWQPVATSGPLPSRRAEHAMAYDSRRGRVVLFGGYSFAEGPRTYLSATWEWDGATWAQVSRAGPQGRCGHTLAYDSERQRVVLFGGRVGSFGELSLRDTWECDGDAWTRRTDEATA